MSRRSNIEDLRVELNKLVVVSRRIEKAILQLEEEEQQQQRQQQRQQQQKVKAPKNKDPLPDLRPKDRDGVEIFIGDHVLFLTKGAYSSTEGVVVRFSKNLTNVFALDRNGIEVPRALRNVRVISDF